MTVKTPAPPPIPDELDRLAAPAADALRPQGRAGGARDRRAQRWDPAEVLRVLLAEEAAGRDQATIAMRRRASGLPAGKTFDAWDQPPRRSRRHPTGAQDAGMDRPRRDLCVCGPSGTGKSHLVEALGHLAIDQRQDRRLAHARSLAALLRRHRADDSVDQARSAG